MRIRGGAWVRLAAGIPARSIRHGPPMKLVRSSGVQLHPTSLPKGRLGAEAYAFVDWLARRGPDRGGRCCRSGRPTATARRTRRSRRSRRGPGCSRSRARRSRRPRSSTSASATPRGSTTGSRSAARGALADQVRFDREWAALRRYALDRGVKLIGDVPIYVAPGQRRPPRPPGALPGRRGRRHAARRVHRQGPAVGQPALRLAGAAAARLPLVGRAPAAHVRPLRPRPRRPLPRLRLLLVGARAGAPRAVRATGSAGPAARSSTRRRPSSATWR